MTRVTLRRRDGVGHGGHPREGVLMRGGRGREGRGHHTVDHAGVAEGGRDGGRGRGGQLEVVEVA